MQRRRNVENAVVSKLLVRGSCLAFHATMCGAAGDLEGLSEQDSNDFCSVYVSHTQGQAPPHMRACETINRVIAATSIPGMRSIQGARKSSAKNYRPHLQQRAWTELELFDYFVRLGEENGWHFKLERGTVLTSSNSSRQPSISGAGNLGADLHESVLVEKLDSRSFENGG
jgi:hypothetical protein